MEKRPMTENKLELKEIVALLKKQKMLLENKYKVKDIGVFGSYVRREQNSESDIDILVNYKDNSIDLFDFLELKEYLSDLMGTEVDLVMREGLKPNIGKNILSHVSYA